MLKGKKMSEKTERVLSVVEAIVKEYLDGISTKGELGERLYNACANKTCTAEEFVDELMFLFNIAKEEALNDAHIAIAKTSPFYDGEYDDDEDDECECEECICDDCKKNKLN